MKKYLSILILTLTFTVPHYAHAAYTFITSVSAQSANAASVTTGSIDTTGANLIVVAIATVGGGPGDLSDSKGNTWTALTEYENGSAENIRLYYCYNPTVGSGHTFTDSNSSYFTYPAIAVMAFSGAASSPFDAENGNVIVGTPTTISTNTVTPAGANELFVTAMNTGDVTTNETIDSGFTRKEFQTGGPGVAYAIAMAYKISSSAENPTWTKTGNGYNSEAALAAFKTSATSANIYTAFTVFKGAVLKIFKGGTFTVY